MPTDAVGHDRGVPLLDLPACSYVGGVTYEGARMAIRPGAACSVRLDDDGINLYDTDGALYLWNWDELTGVEVRGGENEQSGRGILGRKGKGEPAQRCWLAISLTDGRVAEIEVPQPPRVVEAAVDAHLLAIEEADAAARSPDPQIGIDAAPGPVGAAPTPETPDNLSRELPFVGLDAPGAAGEALALALADEVPEAVVTHLRSYGAGGIAAAAAASHALAVGGRALVVVGVSDREAVVKALAASGPLHPLRWLEVARFDHAQVVAWVRAQAVRNAG